MGKFKDLTGQKFGRLTVVERTGKNKLGKIMYLCKCDCGNEKIIVGTNLSSGRAKSCGCISKEKLIKKNQNGKVHGMTGTKIYGIWKAFKRRCFSQNDKHYKYYGGRGITVCDEWKNDFQAFYDWAMANGYKEGLSIDRINNNGNYEPSNCRWATAKEQNRNTRRNRIITYNGESKVLMDWCIELNMDIRVISSRLKRMTVEEAFSKPLNFRRKKICR